MNGPAFCDLQQITSPQETGVQSQGGQEPNVNGSKTAAEPLQAQTTWEYVTTTVQSVLPAALLPEQQHAADKPNEGQEVEPGGTHERQRDSVDEQLVGTGVISQTEVTQTGAALLKRVCRICSWHLMSFPNLSSICLQNDICMRLISVCGYTGIL